MITPEQIKSTLEQALPGSTIEMQDLTGGGDHWHVFIVSPEFEGKGLIEQHQMVYAALKEEMGDQRIHALALKTFTPEQWAKLGS
jgi:acid stress-induced BolA-like protein IbaG/YrbA